MEGAAWFMCPSRVVCLQSHLLHSASTNFGILISTLQGVHATRHHLRKYTQPCHILLRYPGAGRLQLPRQSHLDPVRLRHPPPMGRAHYRPDGTRRRTSGELAARAKKKARREQEAAEAAAAPPVEAEPGPVWPDRRDDVEEAEVEIEVEVEEVVEEPPVRHRPKVRLRPAPKWGAASPDDRAGPRARSRSPYRVTVSAERLFRLSKALTRLLRHKAAEEGLPLRADGFFNVEAIIQTSEMRSHGARSAEILHAIQQDAKKRYTLRHFDGVPWVRAAQGHSQSVSKDLLMRKLRRQELPPYLYHGTRAGNYRSILRSGLLAGGPSGCRTDIHLVEHLPDSGQRVLSGWRSNCELAIQVTPQAASSGGCTFYKSDNGVYLTEGVRGAIAHQFISAVVILQSGEVITSPKAGTAPSGEAVAAGLRRAHEARGGYMCAAFVAPLCQWPLLAIVPYWCAQVAAATLVWHTQFPAQAMMPMLDLPRYKAVKELHHGRVPQVLRTTAGWPMDWPVGPLNLVSFSTGTLLADIHASKFCPCRFSPGRVASNSECAAHWWPLRGASRTTAPLGAVSSHMSYTPNSEASLLWSPNDESEDFPPSPAPAAPTASTAPARETPAVGTPVGSLLGRALRRGHYAPEILRVVEHVLDPVRSDTTTDQNDSGAADVMTTTPRTATTAPIGVPTDITPAPHAPDRPSQVNWADNEVFHFNPETYCLSTVPSASPHPEGMQYGPARRSSRAGAKMLVRAGHRCPTCFCLTSLCRCQRERITLCLCYGPGGHTALSHRRHAHMSFCVSQAAESSFRFRLAPLFVSCARTFVSSPDLTPHGWNHPHPCQWQVLHRSYSRRQRRLSRRARERRSPPSAVAQSVIHLFCNWLYTCSSLATMNPHRPGGGPRQHYRPDGSRRRTAGELAKRAARAAARAAADAAGGGAAKPAATVAADAGTQAVTQLNSTNLSGHAFSLLNQKALHGHMCFTCRSRGSPKVWEYTCYYTSCPIYEF